MSISAFTRVHSASKTRVNALMDALWKSGYRFSDQDMRHSKILDRTQKTNTRWRNAMTVNRRTVIKGALAAGVATTTLKMPAVQAQPAPFRLGFLTVKTGPLASGGLQ